MNKKIEPKIITKYVDTFETNKEYFELIRFLCKSNDEDHMANILNMMRTTKSITIELCSDILPQEIFDELKWLKYFQFNAHITVKNDILYEKYSECSKNITINSKLDQNLLILRGNDWEDAYLIDGNIKKAYILIPNIDQQDVHRKFKDSIEKGLILSKDINLMSQNVRNFKKIILEQICHINEYEKNREIIDKKQPRFYTDLLELLQNDYIVINDIIYQLIKIKNRMVMVDIYDEDSSFKLYQVSDKKIETSYVTNGEKFYKVNEQTKIIDINEDAYSFDDYENSILRKDFSSYVNQFQSYSKIEFHIKLNPPYLQNQLNYSPSPIYEKAESLFDKFKIKIKHETEALNSSFPKTKIYSEYLQMFLNTLDFSGPKLLEWFRKVKDDYPSIESLASDLKNIYNDDIINYIKMESVIVNNLSHNSSINNNNYNWFRNELYATSITSPSSLARILNITEGEVRLNEFKASLLKIINKMLDYYEIIESNLNELNVLEIPKTGILYENGFKKIIAIEYVHEISEARIISKKYNAGIYVRGEIINEHKKNIHN